MNDGIRVVEFKDVRCDEESWPSVHHEIDIII